MRFVRRKSDGQMAKFPPNRADALIASGEYEPVDAVEALTHPIETAKAIAGCDECAKKRAMVAEHMKALAEWARHPMSGPPPGITGGVTTVKPSDPALNEPSLSDKTPDAKVD